jgi:nucleoid DNA-binding protein
MAKTNTKTSKKPTASSKKEVTKPTFNKDLKKLEKPMTVSQQTAYLAETTALTKKDVANLLSSLADLIGFHLKKLEGISLMGLMKIMLIKKPATKAREGINPFTKEPTVFKAKPARKVVKIRALKKLKDMV